jgi:protein-disulfide isomerase
MASVAASNQGKFWEYHDKIFANQTKIKRDDLLQYARELELDMERFEADLLDLDNKKIIDADKAEALSLQATGTPAFFVNGRFLSGAKPFEEFAKVIDEELTKKKIPIPAPPSGG